MNTLLIASAILAASNGFEVEAPPHLHLVVLSQPGHITGQTDLYVSWTYLGLPEPDDLTGHEVRVTGDFGAMVYPASVRWETIITRLPDSSGYTVEVRAVSEDGVSAWSLAGEL